MYYQSQEIINLIVDLNQSLFEGLEAQPEKLKEIGDNASDISSEVGLLYECHGHYECIVFMGCTIWDTEDNGIPWTEDGQPSTSLRDFILNRIAREVAKVALVGSVLAAAKVPE